MTTSLTHGPTTGSEESSTTTAAPPASTASSRHAARVLTADDKTGQDHADEGVGDIPRDDRERQAGAQDRDCATEDVDADQVREAEETEHDRQQDHGDQHDDQEHDETEDRDDAPAG